MKTIGEYENQLGELHAQIEALALGAHNEKRAMSGEELAKSERLQTEYETAKREADLAAGLEKMRRDRADKSNAMGQDAESRREDGRDREERTLSTLQGRAAVPHAEAYALSLQAFARRSAGMAIEDKHRLAAARTGIDWSMDTITLNLRTGRHRLSLHERLARRQEIRAANMTAGTVGEGIETVPEDFQNELEIARLHFGGMRQAASIMVTADGNPKPLPMMDDTSNVGEYLAEASTIGTGVSLAFTQKTFGAHKLSSKLFLISPELLEDSAFDLMSEIAMSAGERIGRAENTAFTNGTGSGEPRGITLDGAASDDTGAALSYAAAVGLEHSVDRGYRTMASFMCNDLSVKALRVLLDSDGRPLWQPSLIPGTPDRFLGYPIIINNDLASSGSSAKVLWFGDLSKYRIREVSQVRLHRMDELFAQTDLVGFVMFVRHDGALLDAGTNPVKYHELAA